MRAIALAILVFVTPVHTRTFHNVTVDEMKTTRHTHVRITGTVTLVKTEADGDRHFRVADEHGHFVVCEIVPYHPLPSPRLHMSVMVEGNRRYDDEAGHGWWEVHPVENWKEIAP